MRHGVERAWRLVRAGVYTLALFLVPLSARAEVTATLAATEKVELGQPIRVELTVSSDQGSPQSPRLDAPPGFTIRGPSVSTRFSTSINGWSAQTTREITAAWSLNASKVGVFSIGPARASVEGQVVESNAVRVQVLPQGSLPAPTQAPNPARRPGSLFDDDFFSGLPGFGRPGRSALDDLIQRQMDRFPQAPPEYRLPRAPDPTAFLDASISPNNPVVGQQVTLRVVAYGAAGRYRGSPKEPRRPDFFSVPLLDSTSQQPIYSVRIGSTDYLAVKVLEFALFPLKTGKLEIGPASMTFYGSNYISGRTNAQLERESQPLFVEVREPPTENRPIDYQLGDVGRYSLTTTVAPRTINVGESLSVIATLEGEGNPPQSLRLPEQKGLEWLEPTVTEQLSANSRRRIEGKRTFSYVVKAKRAGTLDLGRITLPYYDPGAGRYRVASAELGTLVVRAAASGTGTAGTSSSTQPVAEPPDTRLSDLVAPRAQLSPLRHRQSGWAHSPWLWFALLIGPLGVVTGQLVTEQTKAWLARRRQHKSSLGHQALTELRKGVELQHAGDADGAVGALERAVFLGIENSTGVKARAVLREQLEATLVGATLSPALAKSLAQLLADFEAFRFARSGDLNDLSARVKRALADLPSRRKHPTETA